ncbi:hypothetical protein L5515_011830 [Caenorhabditis briggsae]|uniref:mRNA-decapping enzyme 2 n=2 Tax=Caenorhabditis briggsae TaxID=6238 RepID=A0AAE9JH03_CAEBR|nr:hypothetical protein L5515_011830 [Caenorhabditis briggsae]
MSKEESSSVQKLLASLQQAQKKEPVVSVNEPSTSKPKKNTNDKQKKRVDDKKKQEGASVGARMQQQQAENVKSQTKRPRQISTSKGGGRNASGSEYSQQQSVQQYPQSRGPRIPSDILDEIEFRFISNMIESEINDDIRVCFHLELAHWYYIDHMVEDNRYTRCPNVGTRDFTIQMCQHCRSLRKYAHRADEVIAKFREYKSSVPTYGAILVDSQLQNVILVQSYFAKGNNWGFPKGKINQNEPPRDAAIRETFEETGFDFGVYSEKEKKFQRFINDGMVRLYLVKNVPMDFKFEPQTRKEIRKIQWFKIDDLPTDKNDELPAYLQGYKFFMVMPFIRDIQSYIQKEREKLRRQQASAAPVASSSAKSTLPGASEQSILSQLFPSVTKSATNQNVTPNPPILKRLTSEELFSAFKSSPMPQNKESEISRPVLPDMSPSVNGLDTLALLGICTPLKAGASLNQFAAPPRNCPKINEEVEKNFKDHETEVGFAMPTDLQQPLVTTDHPWQQNRPLDSGAVPKTNDSHQGWLDTPLVNTIMHSPNLPIHSSHSPATPSTVLGHLIGKPIQPQPILPQPASQSALGSAEKPKSSKINLSDNSAFTAINSTQKQQSVPKATAAPGSYKVRSSSLSGSTKSKAIRGLFNSVTSPVSSDLPSVHGDDPHMWEEILLREQFAATAGTSISSLAASNQELAMINRDTPIENRNPYMNQIYQQIPNRPKCSEVPCCTQWAKKIQLDTDYIAGPVSSWMQQFSLHKK